MSGYGLATSCICEKLPPYWIKAPLWEVDLTKIYEVLHRSWGEQITRNNQIRTSMVAERKQHSGVYGARRDLDVDPAEHH